MGRVTRAVAAMTVWLLVVAGPAYAAGGAETAGRNLGEMLSKFGGYVLLGIAGCFALGMIASRQVSKIAALFLMVFLIGGLFFAPGEINDMIRSTWHALGRGV